MSIIKNRENSWIFQSYEQNFTIIEWMTKRMVYITVFSNLEKDPFFKFIFHFQVTEVGKSVIFRLKSSQVIADSKKFQVKSSHNKIDWLGSQMTNENWKRLSTYPNPTFISRYIYSAEIIVDLGYIFLLHFHIRKQNWSA